VKAVFVNRFFHPDESATSRMLSDLAFRLARSQVRVVVVTSRQLYENPVARLPAHEVIEGVEVWRIATSTLGRHSLPGRAVDYVTFYLSAALRLLRVLQPGDVVIAKTDPPMLSVIAGRVARWRGASLINWLQDVFPEVVRALMPGAMPRWLHSALVGVRDRSLRQADMNVVIGDSMGTRVTRLGVDAAHIRIIPNWVDCEALRPMATQLSQTRARLGLQDRFVVGYSGNFGRAHDFRTLIAAARLLIEAPQIAFLITGGGARNAELRRAVAREALPNFHFQDYQPAAQLSDSMAAADVHLVSLLPAIEGLIVPSKAYGILAAGRPLVFVGDTDGEIARMIRRHDCGAAVAIADAAGLAGLLLQLQADPARCAALGANSRHLALARYTSERAAADWLEILRRIGASSPMSSRQ